MGSDFLFASPSFITGIGRCLDLFGELDFYNQSPDGQTADALALLNDWSTVGGDLHSVLLSCRSESDAAQLELFAATSP